MHKRAGHVPTITFLPPLGKQFFDITASAHVREAFGYRSRSLLRRAKSPFKIRDLSLLDLALAG